MFNAIQSFAVRSVQTAAQAAIENPTAAAATGAAVGTAAAFGTFKATQPMLRKVPGSYRRLRANVRARLHAWSTETPSQDPAAPAAQAAA